MSDSRKVRMVRCHYRAWDRQSGREGWIPMGRARTRCPDCGAVVGGADHPVEMREPGEVDRG